MATHSLDLHAVIVFLVVAGVAVPLIHRLKVSPVLGYLLVGLVVGPFGAGRFVDAVPWLGYLVIADLDGVRALAELGIVFLLFMIGLELSVERLWSMRRLVFGLGTAQVLVTGAVIAAIASMFDNTLAAALVLGAAFALSSTAIVMQLLTENRRLGSAAGRTSFAILLLQDLAVLPILFVLGAFAAFAGGGATSGGSVALSFGAAIGQAALAAVAIVGVGRLVIRPLFRFVGAAGSSEMFLAAVLLVIIGTAVATEAAGLSMALGAFLAGLVLAETEYRHEISVDIEPFKGLLIGLFFVSVGMAIDIAMVAARPVWLIASVVGLFAIKGVILYGLVRVFGQPRSVSFETALLLGQGGEFAFLVVGQAFALGLLPNETAQFMLIVTGLAMLATPIVARLARDIAARINQAEKDADTDLEAATPAGDLADHVVVVGYGRVGQMLGAFLGEQGVPHVGLDLDANLVSRFRREGAALFYGDASRPAMLHQIGLDDARAAVVTMDGADAAERVVANMRAARPDLPIYARARDAAHAARLLKLGASHVIPETIEASLQLGEVLLEGLGVPDAAARQLIEARRRLAQANLDEGAR